jgi:hypothetical protein
MKASARLSKDCNRKAFLRLERSPLLLVLFVVMYGGAVLWVAVVPLPAWLAIALGGALAASLYRTVALHALRTSSRAVIAIEEQEGRLAIIRRGSGATVDCRLVSHFLHPRLAVLGLRCDGARFPFYVVIERSAVDRDAFRDLRRRLVNVELG